METSDLITSCTLWLDILALPAKPPPFLFFLNINFNIRNKSSIKPNSQKEPYLARSYGEGLLFNPSEADVDTKNHAKVAYLEGDLGKHQEASGDGRHMREELSTGCTAKHQLGPPVEPREAVRDRHRRVIPTRGVSLHRPQVFLERCLQGINSPAFSVLLVCGR